MGTALERDRLREYVDFILDTLDDEVDGAEIAARGCLSRYHFDRLIAAAIGESPGAFRRRILLERAAWELRSDRATITGVALRAGYRSAEGFTRAFARVFLGAPPRRCLHKRTRAPTRGSTTTFPYNRQGDGIDSAVICIILDSWSIRGLAIGEAAC